MKPTPQTSRSRSNCDCQEPCFYCDELVVKHRHQHDHAPIPWRHGGRETVPACNRCHDLKDRLGPARWSPAGHEATAQGTTARVRYFLHVVEATLTDPGPSDPSLMRLDVDRDTALDLISQCSTAEARIATAWVIGVALDVQRRRDLEAEDAAVGGAA